MTQTIQAAMTTRRAPPYFDTLDQMLAYHAGANADRVALSFEGRSQTFADLERRAGAVAAGLLAWGLKAGDRIAWLGRNSDRFYEILLGAARLGVVMTPIGWRLSADEVGFILRHAEVKAVFVGPDEAALLDAALLDAAVASAPDVRHVVAVEGGVPGRLAYDLWREEAGDLTCWDAVEDTAAVFQVYTSGTTGRPKGVLVSHRNILAQRRINAEAGAAWDVFTPDDVNLAAMPVGHVGGAVGPLNAMVWGARNAILKEFDPAALLRDIEEQQATILFVVPAALQILLSDPRVHEVDFSRVRQIIYGAAPIPAPLLREAVRVIGCDFMLVYGLTETTGAVVGLTPADHVDPDHPRLASTGRAFPGVELAILSPQGERLASGETGEIAIRAAGTMLGYWRAEDETRAALSADGWFRTGDAGSLDAEGYLYIRDRIKDMIVTGGENVYAAEVERALLEHPAVAEAAVIGVPDDRWGEAVKALVVLRLGAEASEDALRDACRARLAGFKVPRSVEVVATLPRNATGKVLKHILRQPYWAGRPRNVN